MLGSGHSKLPDAVGPTHLSIGCTKFYCNMVDGDINITLDGGNRRISRFFCAFLFDVRKNRKGRIAPAFSFSAFPG